MTVAPATRGHLIGGEQAPAASGATFDSLDPASGQPFATFALGSAADVDAAVSSHRGRKQNRCPDESIKSSSSASRSVRCRKMTT